MCAPFSQQWSALWEDAFIAPLFAPQAHFVKCSPIET
jgi:hypothetical protein